MEHMSKTQQSHIHIMPTTKFKTTTITVKFMAPLDQQTTTSRALLSNLLTRATKRWPSDKALNKRLSELYGAYIYSNVSKFKDKHVITISLELVNERYLNDAPPLFEQGLELLQQVIWEPLVEKKAFDRTLVAQEKSLLKKKLDATVDNKAQLSFLNLLKVMFGDQAYSELASGRSDMIDEVTPESLYDTYQSMIQDDFCAVYVVGNVDESAVESQLEQYFDIPVTPFITHHTYQPKPSDEPLPREVVEYDDVDQAKLNMGFKCPIQFGKEGYFALIVLNTIFGGSPSSILFSEVREKQSLAYSIHSQTDAKNGYMYVLSGVSRDKYEQAKDTIIKEFKNIQQGELTEDKLALAKKVLISQRLEAQDMPKGIIEILNMSILLDEVMTNEEYTDGINRVTKEDVVALAQQTELDTIYILTKEMEA